MSKYDFDMVLTPDSIPKKIMDRIANSSSVLEFGCAEGRMTKYMKEEKDCSVSIVELDQDAYDVAKRFADDGICSDIETGKWKKHFQDKRFDYILFADVLEHLRNPEQIIMDVKSFLRPGGEILISVPNIAHNDIIASLYNNHFEYNDIGLLDNTHVHFWGEKELETLAMRCDMALVVLDGVSQIPFFTEISSQNTEIPESLKSLLNTRDYNEIYEFFVVLTDREWAKKHKTKPEIILKKTGALRKANFYWDMGSGYTFGQYISVFEEKQQSISIYHSKTIPKNCKKVRFDPPTEGSCIVKNYRVIVDERIECELKPLNGVLFKSGAVLFDHVLGQMEFVLPKGASSFTVCAEILPCFNEGEHQEFVQERLAISTANEKLTDDYHSLEKEYQAATAANEKLTDDYHSLEKEYQAATAANEKLIDDYHGLEKEYQAATAANEKLTDDYHGLEKEYQAATAANEKLTDDYHGLEKEYQAATAANEKLTDDYHGLEKEYQAASTANEKLTDDYHGLEKEYQAATAANEKLTNDYHGLEKEYQAATAANEKLTNDYHGLEKEYQAATAASEKLTDDYHGLEREYQAATTANEKLTEDYRGLEKEYQAATAAKEKLTEDYRGLEKVYLELNATHEQLCTQFEVLQLQYACISDSQFWKMSAPFRKTLDKVKGSHLGEKIHKLARSVRTYGLKVTFQKIKTHTNNRIQETQLQEEVIKKDADSINQTEELLKILKDNGAKCFPENAIEKLEDKETILLISHELSRTGAPIVLEFMAERMKEQGKNPIFVSPLDGALKETCINNGIPVIIFNGIYTANIVARSIGIYKLIVISTINGGPLISQLSGKPIPVIWWIHEARISYHPGALAGLPEDAGSNIHIYCGGSYAQRILHEYRPHLESDQLLYYVPDYASIQMKPAELPIRIDKGKTVFVCAGMMEERKGQDILTQAIRLLPPETRKECLFVFVGGQYYKPAYEAIMEAIKDFPDNVSYIPQLTREELTVLYNRMDCLVCPSRDDPMPTVATEAMALSRLVLCSENTGTAKLIEEMDSGIVYKNNDPTALANSITQIAAGNLDKASICKNARKTYERYFSREAFDQQIDEIYRKAVSREPLSVKGTVSVVIPGFNAGREFSTLLSSLTEQEDVDQVELIIIDSGSQDDTVQTAKKYGAKVIRIKNSEFSHSFARNLGAENASGKYVLFMTQDAKPSSTHWIRDMAQPILSQNAVAVSCREEPRPDCDLLGRFSIWQHSKYMGILNTDRVLSLPKQYNYDILRKNAQLNDVACLVRKDVFQDFKYRGDYAEDLDLGKRMVQAGYRLALLSSAPVIHSHTRSAYYYLKRCLVDVITLKGILPDSPMEDISASVYMNRMISLYAVAKTYIQGIMDQLGKPQDIHAFFTWTKKYFDEQKSVIRKMDYAELKAVLHIKTPYDDKQFHEFIMGLYSQTKDSFAFKTEYVDAQQYMLTEVLQEYLRFTGEPFVKHIREEIAELVIKHCGQLAGVAYASYVFYHGDEKSFLNEFAIELRKGV